MTELAALVVERVSPEELAIFDDVAVEYFQDPARAVRVSRKEETLGFGLNLALVGPYALAVAVPVVQFLGSVATDMAKDMAKDSAAPAVRDLVRRMFARMTGRPVRHEEAPIMLSPAQVRLVQDSSYRNATALGLPDGKARLLADAIIGSLHRTSE